MKCEFFEKGHCLSCRDIHTPISVQLQHKMTKLQQFFNQLPVEQWLEPIASQENHFRNKAKMVVLGAAHQPVLGIVDPQGQPISLCDCQLYPEDMQLLLNRLQLFVQQAGIPPYRVDKRKGELKYILLTRSYASGEFMLRFVLNSEQAISRIKRQLPQLQAEFPKISLVSVNIQPIHMAILEGEQEIFLTDQTRLADRFNDVPLYIRPKSFFQTNPKVAEQLYQTAREWVAAFNPHHIWDLFCGVGGFGLHCASGKIRLTGIEIEAEAIECAKMSAAEMGLENISFRALDSTDFANGIVANDKPDLIIVNPPRRGIGESLCQSLTAFSPKAIVYSSCNPTSLVKDLAMMSGYRITKVQLFDMFPHTDHYEVLVMLEKDALCH
ncbi:23S rRNA (uracil(747)-C(5))-methyltransferase RlmC [Shewanella sp. OMA3-2]|uniref:23S rRNA (uracil(747)-C(5))-methyltransferase RlmC n=1 Tax=Shewanella sp. OMA3-2 TaxID=2908650 RepID=UPI001F3273D5|nr:23S rRNA (uracil(747)-C(5))-methyltransferase RlmC [Shewanella sp. OMA3-2]UJF21803.1 23S rRNA (uracil(747)-C(5))-methyltransferase RlmC [Shewanella sp. OMA3-2]